MFADREDAARQLVKKLKPLHLVDPLVLAIPRGGVVTGAVLARELGADLDVVLSRKLRAPFQPELAIGAVGEDGEVYLNHRTDVATRIDQAYVEKERQYQVSEIARRQKLFRAARPQANVAGRSVILTDDGIATGSTMIAALHVVKAQKPHETIVAVPVAPPERLEAIRTLCDQLIYLLAPRDFFAIGQFYMSFESVEDEEVVRILREFSTATTASVQITAH
jgi:predicted phosphoribosyltransferase